MKAYIFIDRVYSLAKKHGLILEKIVVTDPEGTSERTRIDRKPSPVRCALCKKPKGVHRSLDHACPIGSKHRTVGYTSFHRDQKFEPKVKK